MNETRSGAPTRLHAQANQPLCFPTHATGHCGFSWAHAARHCCSRPGTCPSWVEDDTTATDETRASRPAPARRLLSDGSRRLGRACPPRQSAAVARAAAYVALAAMRAITHVVGKAIGSSRRPEGVPRLLRRQLTSGPTGRPGADVEPQHVAGALLAIGVAPDRGRWRGTGWCSVSVCESRRRVALAGRSDRVADGLSTRGAARRCPGPAGPLLLSCMEAVAKSVELWICESLMVGCATRGRRLALRRLRVGVGGA